MVEAEVTASHTIVKTVSVESVCRTIDDAIDYRVMTRAEALKFLHSMLIEVELRMQWVRDALREEQHHGS